ncbi:DUF4238 domain-containing protein [Bacillus infantis]|uniref:DUF4238 domain-containing protein n=1 Tax=Bacillus infantis TaxID=324767 RepID=UPI002003701F|nr:DUF4238 domain-containing protein [Bacillus infantis]MCK6205740.1 DUF4238 domain-containing protein [Bacillus infantis]
MQKKIQQHYVWEHYLTSWCYNGKQLYCYRKNDNNIFPTNPEKIAKEREFYKLKDITPNEAALIEHLFINPNKNPVIRKINRNWISRFTDIFVLKQLVKNKKNDELDTMIDVLITNLEEDHHTRLEERAIPYLNSLKDGQLNINNDDDSFVDFLLFLSTQYYRTKRIKMNVIRSTKEAADRVGLSLEKNVENIWNISSHILATSFAHTLFIASENFKWTILTNTGNIPFITGDQPVINTHANYSLNETTTELELYYPLSPDKALLISTVNYLDSSTKVEIDENQVSRYNLLMLKASEEQVFSNSREILNNLTV